MAVMVVCGLLVVAGLAAIARWGGLEVEPPWARGHGEAGMSPRSVARRYLWYLTVAVVSGMGAGVLAAGAGGRLAMRLLAVTAGDAAQGRVTEADQVVGNITAGGTAGFILFTALFFGATTGALYLLIRRWLPTGRIGGLAFGGVLLVLAATRFEPLRADNPDFDIVGPGWVSVTVFGVLVIAHGMLVAALAGRYSRVLPVVSAKRRSIAAHAPLLLLLPIAPIAILVILVGVVVVLIARTASVMKTLGSPQFVRAGRMLLVAVVLIALPGFVSTVADIVSRGP